MSVIIKILKSKLIWTGITLSVVIMAILFTTSWKKSIAVKALEIKPGELRVIVNATTTSTVKSEAEAILSAQRTGRVVKLPVKEGDIVTAGALIAQLDLSEESVQTKNALTQSEATYEEAQKNMKRSEELFKKGVISQQDFDAVRRAYEVAKSQWQAAISDADIKKDYSTILAPFSGVIAKKFTEVGELLLPGKQIVTIIDSNKIYVLATIDEVDVGRLRLGQPVIITVDAFPGEKYAGTIKRISPIVSGGKLETRTADVWIYFNGKHSKIKPGMSCDVEILVSTLQGVLPVPSQAIIEREGKKQVYIVEGKGIKPGTAFVAKLKPVEIGETNWAFTQVVKGLAAGDFVIITPEAKGLKDGSKVMIE